MDARAMIVNLRAIAKAAEQGMPSMAERGPGCLRLAADEIERLLAMVERYEVAVTREARENLFSGEELAAASKLGDDICDYIERCRSNLQLDGGIRGGVDHIIRKDALSWLSQRPKIIAEHVAR